MADAPIFFLFHLRSVFCMREYTETLEYRVAQLEFIPKNPEISEADRTGGVEVRPQLKVGGGGEQQLQIYNSILQDRLSHFSLRASCFVEFQDVGLRMRACARVYNTVNNNKIYQN